LFWREKGPEREKGSTPLFLHVTFYKKISNLPPLLLSSLTWIIHGSSLPQMRGTGYVAVVLHRKCPVTKQMR